LVDNLDKAQDIWERLRKNPGGFEKIAQDESFNAGSRSLGGQLAEPITWHAYPRNVADAAFRQLVDGDPGDKDPTEEFVGVSSVFNENGTDTNGSEDRSGRLSSHHSVPCQQRCCRLLYFLHDIDCLRACVCDMSSANARATRDETDSITRRDARPCRPVRGPSPRLLRS
jgi:hypothetical protein